MMDSHFARSGTRRRLRALWMTLALAGCGGGVDSGGTGTPTYASGAITGFGSVIVGGVHFDDSHASVTDADGTARNRDDLRLGMTTEIRGMALTQDASGTPVSAATSIVFRSELVGPVTTIDAVAGRLVVLGQTVDIGAATLFDSVSVSGGLSSLAPGDVVEVYALFDASTGHYAATRIERKSTVANYVLRGVVAQLDPTTRTFSIGGLAISYAAFGGTPPATLVNGGIVRVRLRTAQVGGAWQASELNDGGQRPIDRDTVRLDGRVNSFVSPSQFSIDGVAVDASALAPVGIALGVRVEVEGTARGAVLVASRIDVKTDGGSDFELRGAVASVDATSSSFVLRGVTVVYAAGTEFRNGTAAALVTGSSIEVRGRLSADGTRLLATRITFR